MGSWIRIVVIAKRGKSVQDTFQHLKGAFSDFFLPHSAFVRKTDAGGVWQEQIDYCGAFRLWQQDWGKNYQDHYRMMGALYPLLPMEQIDFALQCTGLDFPFCGPWVIQWLQEHEWLPGWEMYLFGNLTVDLWVENQIQTHQVFRQYDGPEGIVENVASGGANAQGARTPADRLMPCFEVSLQCYPFQQDCILITFFSMSDLWLMGGRAFRGMARGTTETNLTRLVNCVNGAVNRLAPIVEKVELDSIEGDAWLGEDTQVFEALGHITGIHQ